MTENKKEWSEPKLIVLVRSKPEEAVLSACKGTVSVDPSSESGICYFSCAPCVDVAVS